MKGRVDVLLVNPPSHIHWGDEYEQRPNIGLGHISSILAEDGTSNVILDLNYSKAKPGQKDKNEKKINHARSNIELQLRSESALQPLWEGFEKLYRELKPRILGISAVTPLFDAAARLANRTKEIDPDSFIVIGGIHVSSLPEISLKKNCFDVAVIGEGEITMKELCGRVLAGRDWRDIDGIAYLAGEEAVINRPRKLIEDLDSLPFPNREALDYSGKRRKYSFVHIISGRGCYFNCKFCARHILWGHEVRFKSIETVLDELRELQSEGINEFEIVDDTFTFKSERVVDFCRRIRELKPGVSWTCQTRADALNDDLLKEMKEANCARISIGIESGSQKILDRNRKRITVEQITEVSNLVKKNKIALKANIILGFPQETEDDVRKTIDLVKRIRPDSFGHSFLVPFPNTAVYDDLLKRKRISATSWSEYSPANPAIFERDFLSREKLLSLSNEILSLFEKYERESFLRKGRSLKTVLSVLSRNITQPRRLRWYIKRFLKFSIKELRGGA